MPLWPFGRNKKRREASYAPAASRAPPNPARAALPDGTNNGNRTSVPTSPAEAEPRTMPSSPPAAVRPLPHASSSQSRESQRKRRRSPEMPLESPFAKDLPSPVQHTTHGSDALSDPRHAWHPSRVPIPNVGPDPRSIEVPHLEPSPHASRPTSRAAPAPRKKRLSKRKEIQDRAMRDDEIRILSARGYNWNRNSVNGEVSRPDSKRENQGRSKSDKRDSTASLPVQSSSVRSSVSEPTGWEFSALDFFNPRPTVRYSGIVQHSSSVPSGLGMPRHGFGRLAPVNEHISKKSRSKINDLADDFDASDLRVLMERDRRRRDKKKSADFDKLDQSLRRIRAEKERDVRNEPSSPQIGPSVRSAEGPTDVHPAFRHQAEPFGTASVTAMGQPPLSPISLKDERRGPSSGAEVPDAHASDAPTSDSHIPDDPTSDAHTHDEPFYTPPSRPYSQGFETGFERQPLQTVPTDNEASRAARPITAFGPQAMSPPQSPNWNHPAERPSPLRHEFKSRAEMAPPVPPKDAETDERRASRGPAWTQFFRRGTAKNVERPKSEMSFSNTSRESMSRQNLPAHLAVTKIADPSSRTSNAAPIRKQSIFREELADSPTASPASRARKFDADMAAVNTTQTRRQKQSPALGTTVETMQEKARNVQSESPVDVVMTTSLASIDSEGSWLTGRHPSTRSVRKSVHSQLRSSIGSLNRHSGTGDGFDASYEDLSMTEHELVRRAPISPMTDATSTIGDLPERREEENGMIKRQNTSRKTPTLVHRDPQYKSREGLVADYLAGAASPDPSRSPGVATSTPTSDGRDSPTDPYLTPGGTVEIGHGHERHLSTGSAKLLYIHPSTYKRDSSAGQETEERRFTRPKSMPPS